MEIIFKIGMLILLLLNLVKGDNVFDIYHTTEVN
jgi:hypothetical protein